MDSNKYKKAKEKYLEDLKNSKTTGMKFTSVSGEEVKPLYTPDDLEGNDYLKDIGFPGQYPFTRGIHASGYRGKIWTMRQFAGFGTPQDTNERFKYLLANGQTGLSVAFDLPTLMGYDSDDEFSRGEVGICGVAISSLQDMEILFDGIPLDKVSTSMTINSPAAMVYAFTLQLQKNKEYRLPNCSEHFKTIF